MSSHVRALLLSLLLIGLAGAGQAATITIGASDSGWHSGAGNHTITNQNYATGWEDEELRSFFVFDLSAIPITESLLSVRFRAYNPDVCEPDCSYTGGYDSPDATESLELREVLTPAALVTAPSIANPTVFDDLGDGTLFGTHLASSADNGAFIEIDLNAAGIAAAQGFVGVGDFVLGGSLASLTSSFGTTEVVFGLTDPAGLGPYTRELVITYTPEPGTALLLGLGLLGLGLQRRRHA